MPSVSRKQHKLMEAVAHNPAFAKKVGIPRSVGEDFVKADKGKKFKKGGDMKETMGPRNMSNVTPAAGMKKGGKVSSASARADGCCERGKTKGRFV